MNDLVTNPPVEKEAERVIRLLLSQRPDHWAEAERLLAVHPATLPAVARRAVQMARARHRWGLWLDRGSFVGAAVLAVVGLLHAPPAVVILVAAIVGVTGTSLALLSGRALRDAWLNRLDRFVGALETAGAVGLLAEVLWEGDGAARESAARCLTRMLPAAARTRDLALTEHQRRCLYQAAGFPNSMGRIQAQVPWTRFPWHEYAAAALAFAQEREDTAAIPAAERLAATLDTGPLHQQARACLKHLLAAAARDRATGSLLRPAEPPSGETLLRPATPYADTPPDQLLRPADKDAG